MTDRALSDLRVVDISQGIAGPYATKLLADAGANVTKVEPPAGDYSRRLGPFPGDIPDPDRSGLYLHLNTSKRGITLDVSVTSGQVVLKKLLAKADIFVCGDCDPHRAIPVIQAAFEPSRIDLDEQRRGRVA